MTNKNPKGKVQTRRKVYVVVGCKPWNRRLFDEVLSSLPGVWHYIEFRERLSLEHLNEISPRYVFFLHWSWKVPDEIVEKFECVCFHMTDVPFGRGGSPLQNLIVRGLKETKLTALRMSTSFDAGPVYSKASMSLDGSAEEIYLRAGQLSGEMIRHIVRLEPRPVAQKGEAVNFKRRTPEQSELKDIESLEQLYDFIRMLDAEGYPHAFLQHGDFRFEFRRAALYDGRVEADVKITRKAGKENAK